MSDENQTDDEYEAEREAAFDALTGGKPASEEESDADAGSTTEEGTEEGDDTAGQEEESPEANEGDEPSPDVEGEAGDDEDPAVKALREELERQKKIAADNKAWGTRERQKAAETEKRLKELEAKTLESNAPEILEDFPGLEEGINHILKKQSITTEPEADEAKAGEAEAREKWIGDVMSAHPDFKELSKDDAFYKRVQAKLDELGPDSFDPSHTIEEVNKIKAERAAKVKQASDEKQRKLKSMSVPTGRGGAGKRSDPGAKGDTPDYENMDFAAIRQKADEILNK